MPWVTPENNGVRRAVAAMEADATLQRGKVVDFSFLHATGRLNTAPASLEPHRDHLELSRAKATLTVQMNYRVNEFRPIRLDSPRAPGRTAGGARTIGVRQRRPVGPVSVSHFDAWFGRADESRRMN